MKLVTLILLATACHAACTDAWNHNYRKRQQLVVTTLDSLPTPTGYQFGYTFDHASMVSAGTSASSGNDVRVVYCNGLTWSELERTLDVGAAWNTSTTKVWFPLQSSVPSTAATTIVSSSDTSYWLYYGNPTIGFESRPVTTPNQNYALLKRLYEQGVAQNQVSLSNGHLCWVPSVVGTSADYQNCYILDFWLTVRADPAYFGATNIRNLLDDFYAAKATGSSGCHVTGDLPLTLDMPGGTARYFCGPNQNTDAHSQAEAQLLAPQLELLAYNIDGNIAHFSANVATIETAIGNLTVDATTGLLVSNSGAEWVDIGFQDMVKKSGLMLLGSVYSWKSLTDLAALETAAGRSSQATTYQTAADKIKTYLSVNSGADALWDSTDGMYYADTVNNVQPDVFGSAYACSLGIASTTQCSAISAYLVSNIGTLEYSGIARASGYLRMSPTNWGAVWPNHASAPGYPNSYQNGYWPWMLDAVLTSMAKTNQGAANSLAQRFIEGPYMGLEYFASGGNGAPKYTASPAATYLWVRANRSQFPDTTTVTSAAPNCSNVFILCDSTFGSGWSSAHGAWSVSAPNVNQTPSTSDENVKYTHAITPWVTGIAAQVNGTVNSFTASDHATAGVLMYSFDDSGTNTSRGMFAGLRGSDTSNSYLLDTATAWGPSTSFSWTTGVTYRFQVGSVNVNGFSGATSVTKKVWTASSAEPTVQSSFNTGASIESPSWWAFRPNISLMCSYATCTFSNVIVRQMAATEPTVAASGSAQAVAARHRVM